jgi:hypothetical protein
MIKTFRRDSRFHIKLILLFALALAILILAILAQSPDAKSASLPTRPWQYACQASAGSLTCYDVPGIVVLSIRDHPWMGQPNKLARPATLQVRVNCIDDPGGMDKVFVKKVGVHFRYVIDAATAPNEAKLMLLSICTVTVSISLTPVAGTTQRMGFEIDKLLVLDELHANG